MFELGDDFRGFRVHPCEHVRRAVDDDGATGGRSHEGHFDVPGESGDQARAAGKLGDRPLIVLTAGNRADPVLERILSTDEMSRQAKLWIDELQPEQARLSTRGKQVIVPDSGHMIPLERPDAVVAAIREVWLPAR